MICVRAFNTAESKEFISRISIFPDRKGGRASPVYVERTTQGHMGMRTECNVEWVFIVPVIFGDAYNFIATRMFAREESKPSCR